MPKINFVKILILLLCAPLFPATALANGFSFVYNGQTYSVSQETLAGWKGEQLVTQSNIIKRPFSLDAELKDYPKFSPASANDYFYSHKLSPIYDYVSDLAASIDKPVIEPRLIIENGRASEFTPPQDGQKLDVYKSSLEALFALEQEQSTSTLAVAQISPQNRLSDTNNFGISELIAEGISKFGGSPANRRHNIKIGVEKMTGVIVEPGETFSFNKYLGEVDGEHGFLPELVIKKSGTVPEFGGGLCQVSSTAFRAAMDAGLPITERRNHAYAVQYYAPQGTDATIYPGVVDLKFTNDTPGSILVWPYEKDANTLIFDFYGTKDGRQVILEKPVQYDKKTDGSMKAEWTRIVTNNGIISTSTFKSIYQPPSLFHKTEEFAKPTSTAIKNQ